MRRDPQAGEPRFEVKATAETHFSWLRTRMSTERTLMSWVRTGTALIGFGFTIFQVAARLHPGSAAGPPIVPEAPRYLGLAHRPKAVRSTPADRGYRSEPPGRRPSDRLPRTEGSVVSMEPWPTATPRGCAVEASDRAADLDSPWSTAAGSAG
jgi:Domain of unknown function (DUF202)